MNQESRIRNQESHQWIMLPYCGVKGISYLNGFSMDIFLTSWLLTLGSWLLNLDSHKI